MPWARISSSLSCVTNVLPAVFASKLCPYLGLPYSARMNVGASLLAHFIFSANIWHQINSSVIQPDPALLQLASWHCTCYKSRKECDTNKAISTMTIPSMFHLNYQLSWNSKGSGIQYQRVWKWGIWHRADLTYIYIVWLIERLSSDIHEKWVGGYLTFFRNACLAFRCAVVSLEILIVRNKQLCEV